ncbi:MAG: AMP-binding protein [Bacteroidales bacterium]|nr:AMP-binding protein [Saprospiraceae bacterium]MCF8381577.1 AMP-binding protein [Bacteroidales bacterium]
MNYNTLEKISQNFEKEGDKVAFHINDKDYLYKDLSQLVSDYQAILKKIESNSIGVLVSNSIECYAIQLAIWLTGKTFIPLNPKNPIIRNQKILEEASIIVLFHNYHQGIENYRDDLLNIINLSEIESVADSFPSIINVKEDTIAYILFTSGSTGVPKGVAINWRNINSFVDSFLSYDFLYLEEERFLQMFDFSFDVSVASTIIPLILGFSIYTVSDTGVKFTEVYSILEEKEITFAALVPSTLSFLKPFFEEINLPHLRNCILTAEASDNGIVKQWKKCIPNARIFNFYGPTEATIWSTAFEWEKWDNIKDYHGMPPIGKPLKNVNAIIIDKSENILGANIKGELCLSGDHVTLGYSNDNDKNITSFIYIEGIRYYKTGDICFFDLDGDIMYCGRLDHQVQLRGYRVELNEIEFIIKKQFKVNNVIAIPHKKEDGATSVILFIEGYSGGSHEPMEYLKTVLPDYMLPKKIIMLEKFPINNSDKVDRKKLQELIT